MYVPAHAREDRPAILQAAVNEIGFAVEARGTIVFYHEPERLLQLVRTLTERHEDGQRVPWNVADAPPDFIEGKLRAIVGFELHVEQLTGAWKFAQSKNDADRGGVADALATSDVAALRNLSGVVRRGAVD